MSGTALFDRGAQPERTLLAWRRTTLALAVASAAVVRFVTPELGFPAVVAGAAGLLLCGLAYATTSARYRHVTTRLTGDADVAVPASPGAACAALAGALVAVGLGALAFVLVRALP
ncbi:DUF202 domain-containing protein [Pseudokineococcus basanitobsidens]|uniref:DUF202 domain-containing protein n=1 Tax=Pseudokineococcus basanitobsidens TaxID=1926649 RepID=A0ABU8RNE9_9ACTN